MNFPDVLTERWRGVLIAAASFVLLIGCWRAPFLTYDDGNHITENAQVMQALNLKEIFTQPSDYKFFPLTILSYRLDRLLFESWMPGALGSWAPGVRFMTLLYHAGAALLVWRLLLLLGLGRTSAFFAGLLFAVHPMACETVCWASERKTALAGLFGFAALYIFQRFKSRLWSLPASSLLYLLAVLSKPSALGLFPVFCLLELFPLRPKQPETESCSTSSAQCLPCRFVGLIPFAFIALIITVLNIGFHQRAIIPPPGGSLFTALLTDIEILPRYLLNFLIPIRLSLVYYVEPIVTVFDVRLIVYGAVLAAFVSLTLWFAADRRRALFGWLWFMAALSPTLNFVGISNLMQDRFLYLSIPGLLIVLAEAAVGVANTYRIYGKLKTIATSYLVALAIISCARGAVFVDVYTLFKDAVSKQPLAAHAHYGFTLGLFKLVGDVNAAPGNPSEKSAALYRLRHLIGAQDRYFMDQCPDADRQLNFAPIALRAAEYCIEFEPEKHLVEIERYLKLASDGTPFLKPQRDVRGTALRHLAALELRRQRPREAFELAQESVRVYPADSEAKLTRAEAAVALLQKGALESERASLLLQARTDLDGIPPESSAYSSAQELKRDPVFQSGR